MLLQSVVFLIILSVTVSAEEERNHRLSDFATASVLGASSVDIRATTERFNFILRYSDHSDLDDIPLTIYLADQATNDPIIGAHITIQIINLQTSVTAWQTEASGIYHGLLSLPQAGYYDVIVSVKVGEQADLIPFSRLEFGFDREETASTGRTNWLVGFVVILIALTGILVWRRFVDSR